nr:zinc finger, CCHC-type, retrotransposon Gag domain protein [Tanacetum cinerariifolium]
TVTWADFKKLFFLQFFLRAEQERLKREYHSIRQTSTETSMEFMQRFLRLVGFLGATAGTEEEQAKNFQWGTITGTLFIYGHAMFMLFDTGATHSVISSAFASRMVNTRTDADLSAAVQNALQTLLPRIREEIREEFCTGSGSLNAGGNPPPVTIHIWLERFNKQKPHSFEKATAPGNAENWISHMEKIFDVMGCEDAFKTRLA